MTAKTTAEREMVVGALGRIRAKEVAHGHSCELSARVGALEEGLRVLSAELDGLRMDTPKRPAGREPGRRARKVS